MPTIFSHIAIPIAARIALGSKRIPTSMLLAGMLAAIVPDFDGIAFKLGIAYGGMDGHRGYSHSIGFAMLIGLFGLLLAKRWQCAPYKAYLWLALCTFSHPLADCFTNGGIPIPLFWPFSDARFFSPWRPIEVSPIALSRFFSERGAHVLLNELKTVWLPLMSLALAGMLTRRILSKHSVQRPLKN